MGASEVEHDQFTGEFRVQFGSGVSGRYLVGHARHQEHTLELGPISVIMPSGFRATVKVAGPCILDPAEVRKVIGSMTIEQIRAAIHDNGFIRIGKDGDFVFTQAEHVPFQPKFHRHQWVEHPHWGRGQVDELVVGTPDVKVMFNNVLQVVDESNLTVVPVLGERWAFELEPPRGGHCQVIVRCGQPESRGFAGQILVSETEAEDFALAMESLGAVVRRRV